MIKVFLSHSSAQKQLVEDVANELGWDFAILDKFDFESGRKIIDEINNALDKVSVFVFFVSHESLNSDWCKAELANIRDLIDEGKCLFCAFNVDDKVDINSTLIKPWLRQYITNYYNNPKTLARVIQRRVTELIWDKHPDLQPHFVGREKEFSNMMSLLYEHRGDKSRGVIVSGIRHIGRKRFLQELMVSKMNNRLHPSYCPFDVSLRDTDSLDSLIKQLNSFVSLYSKNELDKNLIDVSNHKDIAIELINAIIDEHELIRVDDDGCIVNKNGYVEDWFLDVINHPSLHPKVSIFIASTCSMNAKSVREQKVLRHLQLLPMSKTELKILFNMYASSKQVGCDDVTVDELISDLSGYPEQIFAAIDVLKEFGLPALKQDLPNIKKMFEDDVVALLNEFKEDAKAYQLLLLLAKFEYINYYQLSSLFDDSELNNILDKFSRFAIYECFGKYRENLRLNRVLADYIDRNKLPLDKIYQDRLDKYTKDLLEQTDDEILTLAEDLFRSKKMLSDKRFKVSTEAILPSIALKVIVEQYRAGEYEEVIDLAKRILYDGNRHDYESLKRSVRYWLCLAYCKKGDDCRLELEKEIKYFKDYSYTKYFILGYFERNTGNYPRAQSFYEKALNAAKGYMHKHTSKAAHELVITLMKQGNYIDAFEWAKQNYDRDKTNVYHIEAYFRCYVKSSYPDRDILKELIKAMKNSYDANKDVIVETFEAEYLFYVDKKPAEAINKLKNTLRTMSGPCLNYTAETLYSICKKQKILQSYSEAVKNAPNYVEDSRYVFE